MTNKRAYIYEYQRRCICVRQHICPFTNLREYTFTLSV